MALKLSIFTTVTDPERRGDNYFDAYQCYKELADEVIIVNGGTERIIGETQIFNPWPQEFDWPLIGQQFQRGYEACNGDWVIHADLDFVFHEHDFTAIRRAFEDNPNAPALSFWKYQFILPDRYNLKSRLVIAVNKKRYGNRIKFDSGGDLCQPSLDGQEIKPEYVPEARVPFYNYEKMTKSIDQVMDDCGRMDRAYHKHFGTWQLSEDGSGSDESCFNGYIKLVRGRFHKPQEHIGLEKHPYFVQNTIRSLKAQNFGYNGFELLMGSENRYMSEGKIRG